MTSKKQSKLQPDKVLEYLTSKGWDFKKEGKNYKVVNCVYCGNNNSNFEVQVDRGYFKCWACDEKGSFYDLRKHLGDVAFTASKIEEDEKPKDENIEALTKRAKAFHSRFFQRPVAVNYLKGRGFSDETIKEFMFGCKKKDDIYWLTIPHLVKGKAYNIKYRSMPPADKKWRQESGTKKQLFNVDALSKFDEIILTEGELKSAALWQLGIVNTVSLTGGVSNFEPEWVDLFAPIKKIYLCLDSDEPGQSGAEALSMRLGPDKCWNIVLPDAKDPDEYFFQKGHTADDFRELMKSAKKMNVRNIVTVNQALKQLQRRFEIEDLEGLEGLQTPWSNVNKLLGGLKAGDFIVLGSPPKVGKCLKFGTKIIKYDGTIVEAQNVKVGDKLMGPDSKPRTVVSLGSGKEKMYEIVPQFGDPWGCNENHILSLKCNRNTNSDKRYESKWKKGEVYNITVGEYLKLPNDTKRSLKLWIPGPIKLKRKKIPFDAYWVGLWLGDGTKGEAFLTKYFNKKTIAYLNDFADRYNLTFRTIKHKNNKCDTHKFCSYTGINTLRRYVRSDLFRDGEKRVPSYILNNCLSTRRSVLAGMLDTDGNEGSNGSIEWCTKYKGLMDDFLYLGRSLGLRVTSREKVVNGKIYYIGRLSGDFTDLPLMRLTPSAAGVRNKTLSKFKVISKRKGKYYGFTLKEDPLFLLGDFTVTHNTTLALDISIYQASIGNPVLFMCLEMNAERLAKKIACNVGNTEVEFLDNDLVAIIRHKIRKYPLYLVDQLERGATTEELFDSMRASYRRYGIKFIVFDNIHFAVRSADNLREKLGELSQSFKLLAEELKIPIMVIVHPKKIEGGKQMTANDFRETGAIHADADQIIILHRDHAKGVHTKKNDDGLNEDYLDEAEGGFGDYDDNEASEALLSPFTWIIVDSSRDVQGGRTKLYFEGAKSKYRRIKRKDL